MPIGNAFAILKSLKAVVPTVYDFVSITDPSGLAIDSMNNIYCSYSSSSIKKIDPNGNMTNFVTIVTGGESPSISQIAIDSLDNVYSTDGISQTVFPNYHFNITVANNSGIFSTYIKNSGTGTGICIDSNNNMYFSASVGWSIIKYDANANLITNKLGNLTIKGPSFIALDSNENVYISDTFLHKIFKITKSGANSVYAGFGGSGFTDGNSLNAKFNTPQGLCFDNEDNLYVADTKNNRIRKITPSGQVTTIAGTGVMGDKIGSANQALFKNPTGLLYKNGIIYITDKGNNKIKKLII
jgi:sugar lactone lactonase YvrE